MIFSITRESLESRGITVNGFGSDDSRFVMDVEIRGDKPLIDQNAADALRRQMRLSDAEFCPIIERALDTMTRELIKTVFVS